MERQKHKRVLFLLCLVFLTQINGDLRAEPYACWHSHNHPCEQNGEKGKTMPWHALHHDVIGPTRTYKDELLLEKF